jgi:8-amino-3,8-dideoxy-alpha-D-manno-octulosonate transaminase
MDVDKKRTGGPGSYLIGEEERKEILDVLEYGHLYRYGDENDPKFKQKVLTFEKEFAELMGVPHCLATSSGTGSILTSLAALGIGADDEVIVPGYTYIASISAPMIANAVPVLCEIDESLTMDPSDIEKRITPKTKAIMPVHMLGNPCDLDPILEIANKHNLFVLEDCCQGCGASYKGKRVGSYGDIAAFSLNVFKTITTGDGGAVLTKDKELYEKAFGYHDQGHKPNHAGVYVGARSVVGTNFRMNELSGAVSLAQTRKLNAILAALKAKKARLKAQLAGIDGVGFRKINDEDECCTLVTIIMDTKDRAEAFTVRTGIKPLSASGWHVYSNMEHFLNKRMAQAYPFGMDREYTAHMLPKTDDLLDRAFNLSVGVTDKGIGAEIGIDVTYTDDQIDATAAGIRKMLEDL